MSCINFDKTFKYSFTKELIEQTRDLDKLLTLELELSHECNYRCKYCYSVAGKKLQNELTLSEIMYVIDQAQDLWVRTIVIIGGGEPLLYPYIKEIIKYIFSRRINIIIFTNGSCLSKELAKFLYSYGVFPVLKANGITPKTMNWLCGTPDAYTNFIRALDNLYEAGYTKGDMPIGISTIICRQNYEEIIPLWRWVRDSGLIPYFERVTIQGRAKNNNLKVSSIELKNIFDELSSIDREEYNNEWESVHPPIAGSSCRRHYYSLYIKADGNVIPCSGIDLAVGNIRDELLQNIISQSEIIQELRHIDDKIKGKCRNCDLSKNCYGCRANAYMFYGDYLEEDPLCWRNGRFSDHDNK